MGEAPSFRCVYGILLDYDSSGTVSRNLLESFRNILLLVNRRTATKSEKLPSRTF